MKLSAREVGVLQWLANGKTAAEIALIFGTSVITVKGQMQSINRKLDTHNAPQSVAEGFRKRLIV